MKKLMIWVTFLLLLNSCGPSGLTPTAPLPTSAAPLTSTPTILPKIEIRPTITSEPTAEAKATVTTPASTAAPAAPNSRPNIIFILSDDLDAAEMSYMPNLKADIADAGALLTHYFVPESLCCPSRSSTLRGQYPHNTQVLTNQLPFGGWDKFNQLGEEKSTIATWLQTAGYKTMLAGKYLNGYPGKDNPAYIPPGWSEWYSAVKGNPYSEYDYTLNENGKQVAYGKTPQDYGTDVYFGKALDFIKRSAQGNQPYFIYLAPYAPHAPYTPAPRHANLFPGVKAPRTPNYNEADVSDKPAYIRDRPLLNQKQETTIDEAYRKRLQALQAVDEGIKAIVDQLKANGQLNNTYIFFTSDNGYHLGNHRQVVGKISPYEEELHLRLMVRGPGVPAGTTLDHLVGNIDLAPTWAELAGAKAADFVDGRSLVPLLGQNPPALSQWRQAFSLEYGPDQLDSTDFIESPGVGLNSGLLEPQDQDEKDVAAQPTDKKKKLAIPSFRGVRLQNLSYVIYKTDEVEVYDIKADPYELQNLASKIDPNFLKQLGIRVSQLATCKADTCRAAENALFTLPAGLAP